MTADCPGVPWSAACAAMPSCPAPHHSAKSAACFVPVCTSLPQCLTPMPRRLFSSAAERVMNRLRNRVFSHITRQEIGFFDRVRTGELVNRLSEVGSL